MVFIIYPYGVGTAPNWAFFRAQKVPALNSSDHTQHRGARSKQNGATHPPGRVCGTIRFFPFVKPQSNECTDKTLAKYGPVRSHPDPEPAQQPTKYRTTHLLRQMCGNNCGCADTWSLPSVTTHLTSTWTSPQYPQPPKPRRVCGNIRSLPYVKTHPMNEHMHEPPIHTATQATPQNDDPRNCVPHTCQSGCVVNIRSIPYMKTHPTRTRTSPPSLECPPPEHNDRQNRVPHLLRRVWFYIMLATNEDP
ncbi:hypothetical protein BS47DRAFT_1360033 [Hydnum rufescens UP504]|uniref:Uncharacterized protein n=1 Tax=Hydnum rufescens UP504 TaxID=1448309 RepID=A0A9P6DZ98_9AGAM|nr:hypothetical protein BS47DRAFT_1360033 [Hydnum rufescens UP504]